MERGIFKRNNAKGTTDKGVVKSTIHMISKVVLMSINLGLLSFHKVVTKWSKSGHQIITLCHKVIICGHQVVTKWDRTLVPNEQ